MVIAKTPSSSPPQPRRKRTTSATTFSWEWFVALLLLLVSVTCVIETTLRLDRAIQTVETTTRQQALLQSIQARRDEREKRRKKQETPPNDESTTRDDHNTTTIATSTAMSAPRVNCSLVLSWEDVQRCRNGVRKVHHEPSDYVIRLLGERNSGTKFVLNELKRCLGRRVPVHRDYTRSKHWFQVRPEHVRPHDRGNYHPAEPYHRAILLTTHRDPTDWVAAMIEKPYHMLNHVKGFNETTGQAIPLEWEEFVKRPWDYPRTDLDRQAFADNRHHGTICSYDLMFSQVTPCLTDKSIMPYPSVSYHAHNPVYELRHDGSMEAYEHILQLRADKIKHYVHEVFDWEIGGYLAVRYEDLLRDGTGPMIRAVADLVGIDKSTLTCQPQGPQPDKLHRRYIPDGLREWVNQHVDNATEHLLGYR